MVIGSGKMTGIMTIYRGKMTGIMTGKMTIYRKHYSRKNDHLPGKMTGNDHLPDAGWTAGRPAGRPVAGELP
jgi:hypothetical protein